MHFLFSHIVSLLNKYSTDLLLFTNIFFFNQTITVKLRRLEFEGTSIVFQSSKFEPPKFYNFRKIDVREIGVYVTRN